MASDERSRGFRSNAQAGAGAGLDALARRAEAVLLFERIWPPLAWAGAAVALFLAVSWLGLWFISPRAARIAGVVLFARPRSRGARAARAGCGARLAKRRWRGSIATRRRRTGPPHRSTTGSPRRRTIPPPERSGLFIGAASPKRSQRIPPASPSPRMVLRDPRALRFGALLLGGLRRPRRGAGALRAPRRRVRLARDFARPRRGAARRLDRPAALHRQAADPDRRFGAGRGGQDDRHAGRLGPGRARRPE